MGVRRHSDPMGMQAIMEASRKFCSVLPVEMWRDLIGVYSRLGRVEDAHRVIQTMEESQQYPASGLGR